MSDSHMSAVSVPLREAPQGNCLTEGRSGQKWLASYPLFAKEGHWCEAPRAATTPRQGWNLCARDGRLWEVAGRY